MKKNGLFFGVPAIALLAAGMALIGCDTGGGTAGPAAVSALDLTGLVARPVEGETPNTAINAAQYTGTIAWKESGGAGVTGAFAINTAYEAVVTLTEKSGYTFAGVGANSFTHYSGAESVSNAANSGTVTIVFSETKNLLFVGASGTAETDTGTLAKAFTWLASNAENSTAYTIKLNANESGGPKTLNSASLNSKTGVTVTLTTVDTTPRTVQLSSRGVLFTVGSGVTFSLDGNAVVKGRADNNSPLIRVTSGGTLELKGSAKITGNTTNIPYDNTGGSGVQVTSGGIFNMTGGEISGNHIPYEGGGGVYIGSHGGGNVTFNMSGGKITGNTAAHGAGVFVRVHPGYTGTFTMSGTAEISGNTASGVGGGVWVNAREDDNPTAEGNGTFNMQGGAITGNTAGMGGGGVGLMKANFAKTGGTIAGNNASTFTVPGVGSVTLGKAVFAVTSDDIDGLAGRRNADAGATDNITVTWNGTSDLYSVTTGLLND
jgi:hypothetical protein